MTDQFKYKVANDSDGEPIAGIIFGLVATAIILSLIYGAYCLGHGYGLEVGMNLGTLGALD